jgi:hypothetical protein
MEVNIEQIKAHKWVGNAYSDMLAFTAINRFVKNTNNSLKDRAEALRQMSDKGMGCGRDEEIEDEMLVKLYMSETS